MSEQTATPTGRLAITQVKSAIGTKPKQRATLRTLGLGRRGATATQENRSQIRGMVAAVSHLVAVEEVE